MIQRALIHVDGPPGAGKTAFVERLVAGCRHWVLAVRWRRDPRCGDRGRPARHDTRSCVATGLPARVRPACSASRRAIWPPTTSTPHT